MIPITMYRADDGSIFPTEAQALARDAMHALFGALMAPLGKSRSLDTNEYIQHDRATVQVIRAQVVQAALPDVNGLDDVLRSFAEGKTLAGSMIGRYLDSNDPRSRAWGRLCCIDEAGREWQQQYFAINGNPKGRAVSP